MQKEQTLKGQTRQTRETKCNTAAAERARESTDIRKVQVHCVYGRPSPLEIVGALITFCTEL